MSINSNINSIFQDRQVSDEIVQYQRFVYGVVGTTAAGWGILIAFIIHHAFPKKEKWVWTSMATALTIWFCTDTSISIYYKAYTNAAMNTLMYIGVALPLIFTKKDFG